MRLEQCSSDEPAERDCPRGQVWNDCASPCEPTCGDEGVICELCIDITVFMNLNITKYSFEFYDGVKNDKGMNCSS